MFPLLVNVDLRKNTLALIKPLVPKTWKLQPFAGFPDVIDRVTLALKLDSIKPSTKANGLWEVGYTLTVAEPKTAPGPSDDSLDESVMTLCQALDLVPELAFTGATRVAVSDTNPGYDLAIVRLVPKPQPTP